jgi:hypothetical protein
LTALTRPMSMEEIDDLPPTMKPHVVGVPRTWVQLLCHLVNIVVHYSRDNRSKSLLVLDHTFFEGTFCTL